eukprot:4337764-Pyramimonas_sp.AAC.1
MKRIGMPVLIYTIMSHLRRSEDFPTRPLECIEYFSGVGNIYSTFKKAGFPALGYDIEYDSTYNDLCSTPGFLFALVCMMSLSPDGLA